MKYSIISTIICLQIFPNNGLMIHSISPWWNNHRIHDYGFLSKIHACVDLPVTWFVDTFAYNGTDVRKILHSAGPDSIDLGCGVGLSTPTGSKGVDSSVEMIAVARFLHPKNNFHLGIIEKYGTENMVKVSICSFVLHQQSRERRMKILKNAYRICQDYVLVMDIDPAYQPSDMILDGEPYLLDYLLSIDSDIIQLFPRITRTKVIENHVVLWNITKVNS